MRNGSGYGALLAAFVSLVACGAVVEVSPVEGNATPAVRKAVARLKNGEISGTFAAADSNGGAFNGLTLVGDVRRLSGLMVILR